MGDMAGESRVTLVRDGVEKLGWVTVGVEIVWASKGEIGLIESTGVAGARIGDGRGAGASLGAELAVSNFQHFEHIFPVAGFLETWIEITYKEKDIPIESTSSCTWCRIRRSVGH